MDVYILYEIGITELYAVVKWTIVIVFVDFETVEW